MYSRFSYENVNDAPYLQIGEFESSSTMYNDSIAFGCLSNDDLVNRSQQGRGWKLQISIDENDLLRAWDFIREILIKYRLTESKVLKKGHSLETKPPYEQGKQITLYIGYDLERLANSLELIMNEITIGLANSNIRPSYRPVGCASIQGSNYLSYRNDFIPGASKRRNYLEAAASLNYEAPHNPFNQTDPFSNIRVNCNNQPPIPIRVTNYTPTLAIR